MLFRLSSGCVLETVDEENEQGQRSPLGHHLGYISDSWSCMEIVRNWCVSAESKIKGKVVVAVAKSNPEAGKFALKDKDAAMAAAFGFLRSKGAFPEDNDDDSDDMVFGDDDNLDDY